MRIAASASMLLREPCRLPGLALPEVPILQGRGVTQARLFLLALNAPPKVETPVDLEHAIRVLLEVLSVAPLRERDISPEWRAVLERAWKRELVGKLTVPIRFVLTPRGARLIGYEGELDLGG